MSLQKEKSADTNNTGDEPTLQQNKLSADLSLMNNDSTTTNTTDETDETNETNGTDETNETNDTSNSRKKKYEVVFYVKYTEVERPNEQEISTYFTAYGDVGYVKLSGKNETDAYVHMLSLNTESSSRRTRLTINKIISEMKPDNKFYINVARSRKRFNNYPQQYQQYPVLYTQYVQPQHAQHTQYAQYAQPQYVPTFHPRYNQKSHNPEQQLNNTRYTNNPVQRGSNGQNNNTRYTNNPVQRGSNGQNNNTRYTNNTARGSYNPNFTFTNHGQMQQSARPKYRNDNPTEPQSTPDTDTDYNRHNRYYNKMNKPSQ